MDIAKYIDHSLLSPAASSKAILQLCEEAVRFNVAAVCIPAYHLPVAAEALNASPVQLATVIGFPFGYGSTASKLAEASYAISRGAKELDAVISLAAMADKDYTHIRSELQALIKLSKQEGAIIKWIIESGSLDREQLQVCIEMAAELHPDFVKTSTGFFGPGADTDTVRILRQQLPGSIKIKASGGIRTFAFARDLISAGADRIGCSATVNIIEESRHAGLI